MSLTITTCVQCLKAKQLCDEVTQLCMYNFNVLNANSEVEMEVDWPFLVVISIVFGGLVMVPLIEIRNQTNEFITVV